MLANVQHATHLIERGKISLFTIKKLYQDQYSCRPMSLAIRSLQRVGTKFCWDFVYFIKTNNKFWSDSLNLFVDEGLRDGPATWAGLKFEYHEAGHRPGFFVPEIWWGVWLRVDCFNWLTHECTMRLYEKLWKTVSNCFTGGDGWTWTTDPGVMNPVL